MTADVRSTFVTDEVDADQLRLYETLAVEKALLGALERNGQETLALMRRIDGGGV